MFSRNVVRVVGSLALGSSGAYIVANYRVLNAAGSDRPPSVDDLTLQTVQVFFRHGARTPLRPVVYLQEAEWSKEKLLINPPHPFFPYKIVGVDGKTLTRPPDGDALQRTAFKGGALAGHLTKTGKEQVYELGRRLRREYVEKRKLLSPVYDESQVFIRSTNIMRTVESAQWAASGLFDVTNKTKPIVINCELDEDEILYPNVTFCTVLKNVNKKLFEAMEKVPGIEEDRAKLAKALNYTAEKKLDYQELRDELSARLAHGIEIPEAVTALIDLVNKYATEMLKLMVSGPDQNLANSILALSSGRALKMVSDTMEAAVSRKKQQKIYLYSAHDSLMISFLLSLGLFDGKWPPFAADVLFELYTDRSGGGWVRVLYLGKPQRLGGKDGVEVISLEEFKKLIAPFALDQGKYLETCSSQEEEAGAQLMDVIGGSGGKK